MKYSVGYQITDVRSYDGKTYMEYIVQNKEHISELYFSWGDIANGRCSMLQNDELLPWEAQQRQIRDLEYISKSGIALNLLLNANCYGVESQSRSFSTKSETQLIIFPKISDFRPLQRHRRLSQNLYIRILTASMFAHLSI